VSTLLTGLVDDAAVFPPGNASVHDAIVAHRELRHGGYSEAVGPLLIRASQVAELVDRVHSGDDLAVGLIATVDGGLVELAQARDLLLDLEDAAALVQVELALPTDHEPAAAARALLHELAFSAQAYVEVPRTPGWEGALDVLAADGVERAKFRTGGTTAQAHPSEAELAAFLHGCVERSLAFKLTAGLHHALRQRTDEGFEQHGLLNVLAAVAVAHGGGKPADLEETLASRDSEQLLEVLDEADHTAVRESFVSFGCCGVTEPLDELADLGLTLDDQW
jgi:hypothetical protein